MHTYPYMCEEISGTKQMPQNNTRKTFDHFNFSNTIYPYLIRSQCTLSLPTETLENLTAF